MTHVLFFAALLLLPLIGLLSWRIDAVRSMPLGGRIAVAGATGALIVTAVMSLMSLVHLEWSRTSLVIILGAIAIIGARGVQLTPRIKMDGSAIATLAVFAIILIYGLLTARESAGDLQFFWGPKAIHFYRAGGIDASYLANKEYPNSDYPPLLPLVYAWCLTVARQFSWWSALLSTVLALFGAAAILRAFSGSDHGAVLFTATLSWALAVSYGGGAADPPLVFFETLALAALTFIDDERSGNIVAAIGLTGAALTKIEGSTFLIAVIVASAIVQRRPKRAILIAAPAIIAVLAWVAFLIRNHLIFGYGGAKMAIHLSVLPKTIALIAKAGLYELYGLPWIVPIVLIATGSAKRALLPIAVTLLTLAATAFFYIHIPDPDWWIASSAPRVLMTPLMALVVAAVAATTKPGTV